MAVPLAEQRAEPHQLDDRAAAVIGRNGGRPLDLTSYRLAGHVPERVGVMPLDPVEQVKRVAWAAHGCLNY